MNFASIKNAIGQVVQSASSSARDFGATVCPLFWLWFAYEIESTDLLMKRLSTHVNSPVE